MFQELGTDADRLREAGIETLIRAGDCHGPETIAAVVYERHRFAPELGEDVAEIPHRREITELSSVFELP